MHIDCFFTLSGCVAVAAGRVLPSNVSATAFGDHSVIQTAGSYNPNNLASDSWWDKYQKKGYHYQCLFEANDEDAGRLVEDTRTPPSAQSMWKGSMYAERFTWNWHDNYFDEDNCDLEELHLKVAFDALKVNTKCEEDGGHNTGWSLGHYDESRVDESDSRPFANMLPPVKQTYTVGDMIYKSTGGYYAFVINQIDGAIIVLDITSPRKAVKTHWKSIGGTAKAEDLPKLQYGSDLIWGKWVEDNANIKNIRVYAVHNVLNDETTVIVSRAMRNKLVSNLALWPGTVFDKGQDPVEFQALVGAYTISNMPTTRLLPSGSPIGGTIAIMLVQHKTELGNKEIYQVSIVSDNWSLKSGQITEMHMFFHIGDVPPSKSQEEAQPADAGTE